MYVDGVIDLAIEVADSGRMGASLQILKRLSEALREEKIQSPIVIRNEDEKLNFVEFMNLLALKDFENSRFRLPRKGGVPEPSEDDLSNKDLA